MDKQNYLQFIASFMMVLILTLPFYTTSVYASINSVSVKGSDGLEGVVKSTDTVEFAVDASISGDTIGPEQVYIGLKDTGTRFTSCAVGTNNNFICKLKLPSQTFTSAPQGYTVNLYRDDGAIDTPWPGTVLVDNRAPRVTLTASQSRFSTANDVKIDYDTTDFSCSHQDCANQCVGLKSIQLYTLDNSFTQTVDVNSPNCNAHSTVTIQSSKFKNGNNAVFAKAMDNFGQLSSVSSVSFAVDTKPPEVKSSSFSIERKGIPLSSYSPNSVAVDVFVNISSDDLDLASVFADLSQLAGANSNNALGTCALTLPETVACRWTAQLTSGAAASRTVTVKASETSGNKMEMPLTKSFSLDDKGPVVSSLVTSNVKNDKSYAKASGNTVFAAFDETTGLAFDDVFLHIGASTMPAKNCTKTPSWACAWDNVNFGTATSMSIDTDTKDILGNPVSTIKRTDVIVDTANPVLIGLSITPLSGLTEAIEGIFKVGDKLYVEANLTDDNDLSASGDFSKFIDTASSVSGSCRKTSDGQQCTWTTDRINLAANGNAVFTFTDAAGNSLVETRTLTTIGLDTTEVPDLWKSDITCSPATIDRQTGTLINPNVYCSVKLKLKTARQASTVVISPAECDSVVTDDKDSVDASDFIEKVDTLNAQSGSVSPLIKLKLKKNSFNIDNATISCSMNIVSKLTATNTITQNPEIENEKIFLQFYNLPLGELGSEVQKKIHDAKKEARDLTDKIGTLNNFINTAKKICQLIHTISAVAATLFVVTMGIKTTEAACHATLVGDFFGICETIYAYGAQSCGTTDKTAVSAEGTLQKVGKFCDYVTCKKTFLWGDDVNSWINEKAPIWLAPGRNYGSNNPQTDLLRGIQTGRYMDPQNNLLVATAFACIPGIVTGMDKYRQIQCLYADCLENSVGKEGLPLTACQDQKAYATCKYVTGEIFAIIPWTAFFDHWANLLKQALSNPFTALGMAASVLCGTACNTPADAGASYYACRGVRIFNLVGDTLQNVQSFQDGGLKNTQDYCSRLNFDDLDAEAPAQTEEESLE
ncbi:MAG TPA: hypothetical protein VJI97_00115 [Candidatus Nanoarchaeia archaeon]|nr:hypothetical protein [Candidatus Nanoarchaeia archaeon]